MNAFVASELDIHGNVVSRRVVNSDRICSISVESASPSVARVFMKNGDVFRFPVEGKLKDLIEGKWPPPPHTAKAVRRRDRVSGVHGDAVSGRYNPRGADRRHLL